MGDVADAPCAISQSAIVRRRRGPGETVMHDIESMDIEDFAQKEMTKASYSSYFGPFLAYAVKQAGNASFFSSGPITAEFFQQHKIRSICSTTDVENYLQDEFSQNGRRRGVVMLALISTHEIRVQSEKQGAFNQSAWPPRGGVDCQEFEVSLLSRRSSLTGTARHHEHN